MWWQAPSVRFSTIFSLLLFLLPFLMLMLWWFFLLLLYWCQWWLFLFDGVTSIRYIHLIFSSSQNPMTQQVPVYNTIFCKIHWHKKPFHKLPSIPSIVTHGFPNWTFQARSVPFRTRALVRWRPCVSVGSAPIGWAPPHQGRCSSPPPVLPSGMAL